MKRCRFRGAEDLIRLQHFTARCIRDCGRTGMLHPGDIPHHIYNGLRHEDPHELVHIWEDGTGEIVAWTLLDPAGAGFDPQLSPGARQSQPELEREVYEWSEWALLQIMAQRGMDNAFIETDAYEDDVTRVELLESMGWEPQSAEVLMLTRRSLNAVDPPQLPTGYLIRTVRGVEEAGPVSELHAAGFGSSWTPELYRRVMESPGYAPEREFLVEAADGTLAGFCVTWPDETNRTGYFEPVAVHPEHQRLGLGRALLRTGMLAMRGWGMEWAEVMYGVDNPASGELYRGEGFEPRWKIVLYRKPRVAGG